MPMKMEIRLRLLGQPRHVGRNDFHIKIKHCRSKTNTSFSVKSEKHVAPTELKIDNIAYYKHVAPTELISKQLILFIQELKDWNLIYRVNYS